MCFILFFIARIEYLDFISTLFAMIITLKNFVILLGSLLLISGTLSYAMKENESSPAGKLTEPSSESSPAGQLTVKSVKVLSSYINELPLEVVYYMTEFLNMADFLHFVRTRTYFYHKLRVLLFKTIRSAACKGYWRVPPCDIIYYELFYDPLPRTTFFSVVSQSDVDLLIHALALRPRAYLKAIDYADKNFLLAIAEHNNFTQGVAILQNEFKIIPKNCQELVRNMKFPLTEDLLVAAIHLISLDELKELLNGQDASFDPSLNDVAILRSLVYAVHYRKIDHAKVLFNSQYIQPYFLPEKYCLLDPYIDYSCNNFKDTSFLEFLIDKQPTNTEEFVITFGNCLRQYDRTNELFNLYAAAPEFFLISFPDFSISDSPLFWEVKPEELFVMLQDCSLEILPCISDASWEQFASAPYNDRDVKCLFEKYRSPKKYRALSAAQCWKEITAKFNDDRNPLDQNILLEKETFLVVFIKYFCKQILRFTVIVDFLNDKAFLLKPMRNNILAHFRNPLQDQSYFKHLEEIGFASC